MPVAALTTLGCKVNQYETERIAEDFASAGFALADFSSPADVYVINSCSVTAGADKASRALARKAARTNPDALVVMTGCHSEMVRNAGGVVDGANLLVPNHEKMATFARVLEARPDVLHYSSSPATVLPARGQRTRATLKVQDGCTHFCGFCSIPYTRKVKVSRHAAEVLDEARRIADTGTQEIVVTGVCVGAYDHATGSGGPDLAELLVQMTDIPGVARVRLSSIQPIEMSDGLIDAFASRPQLCPHLHLSCQSGDDTILRAMNRPYDTGYYESLVARIRARVPDVAITTDLIVGYPGETEAMHRNTLAFARRVGFCRTHVFSYSPRPQTLAQTLNDDVTPDTKKRRHRELQAVVDETGRQFAARFVGETVQVLVEGKQGLGETVTGHTPHYVSVTFPGDRRLRGQIVPVRVTEIGTDGATGEIALSPVLLAARLALLPAPKAGAEFMPLAMANA